MNAFTFGPNLFDITCGKCGAQSDAGGWITDKLGFDREPNHFQCPACGYAFQIVKTPPREARNRLQPVQPSL